MTKTTQSEYRVLPVPRLSRGHSTVSDILLGGHVAPELEMPTFDFQRAALHKSYPQRTCTGEFSSQAQSNRSFEIRHRASLRVSSIQQCSLLSSCEAEVLGCPGKVI